MRADARVEPAAAVAPVANGGGEVTAERRAADADETTVDANLRVRRLGPDRNRAKREVAWVTSASAGDAAGRGS